MKKIKRYGMGGAVQSLSSPMLAQGMQGDISGFGTSSLGTFANGGQVKMVQKDEGNYWYRRTEGAIGSFQWKYDNRYPEGILFALDEFDTKFYQAVKLKKGEVLFRYETDVMIGGMQPLIKLNLDKSLIYFLENSDASDEDEPKFESRGVKAEYIVLEEGYDKKFAKGGKTNDEHYVVQVYTNGKVGADSMLPNLEPKPFANINDAMRFAKSLMDENFSEIDKITILTSNGKLVQKYTNSDSDKNVKEKRLYKQKIPNNYQGKTAEQVWSLLTPYQRSHYLDDHENEQYKEFLHSDWNELNDRVRNGFEMHVQEGQYAKGGEVEDKNQYDFSIRIFKDNLDVLNEDYDYEDFRGTKEEVLKKVNDSLKKGEIVYAYISIENIVTDWYHESSNLQRMRMTLNRYGENEYAKGGEVEENEDVHYTYNTLNEISRLKEKGYKTISLNGFDESINYVLDLNLDDTEIKKINEDSYETTYAKGGEIAQFQVGDIVTHKKGRKYGHGRIYKTSSIGIYLEDKFGNKREQPFYFPLDFKKVKRMFADGGEAEVHIENADVNFDEKLYKGLLSDFDLDGLPNVDDPDPFGNQDKKSIEQVQFSDTFKKVLDTKKDFDDELKKFVAKLQNSTSNDEKIYGRSKTPFSILNKLVDSRLLDEKRGLKDLVGTTITFKNTEDLKKYMKNVSRGDLGKVIDFDDYYANPNDGYRAYHFIIEQDSVPIELQLKTDRMKEINILSHDAYKNKSLNKEYMLYLTSLANEADNGNGFSKEQFNMVMRNKAEVRKMLNSKTTK